VCSSDLCALRSGEPHEALHGVQVGGDIVAERGLHNAQRQRAPSPALSGAHARALAIGAALVAQ